MDHTDVARSGLDEYLTGVKLAVDGLTPMELYWQPTPNSSHIAWTVWHMARAEDYWYNGYIGQGEMVWTAGDFCTKLRLPAERGGAGDSAETVAEFPKLDMVDIQEYFDEVRTQSLKNLAKVTSSDLSQTRDSARGEPPTIAWVLAHVLVEEAQHFEQVAYLRGMLRGLNN